MRDREEYVQRRMQTCRNFTGTQHGVCKVGIEYPKGPIPCIRLLRADPPTIEQRRVQCASLVCYTREEAEVDHDDLERAMGRMRRVMVAIQPWRTWTKDNRVGKAEVIECPECKGKLHLSQSAYNGHVHGQCETKGCVSWME